MLNSKELEIIKEEENHLKKTIEAIFDKRAEDRFEQNFKKELEDIRDVASEKVKEEDLPALYEQHHLLMSRAINYKDIEFPDTNKPYFAHMKTKTGERTRNIYLGHTTFIDTKNNVTVIDWKNAPLSKIYFNYRPGDEYDEEIVEGKNDKRFIEGEILQKRVLNIENKNLIEIQDQGTNKKLIKDENGNWNVSNINETHVLAGGEGTATRGVLGTGQAGKAGPEISALLDETQFALLNMPSEVPIVIQGSAGSGKTTVGIHRIAVLKYRDPVRFNQNTICAFVPEVGLKFLSSKLLMALGIEDKIVNTYNEWIFNQGKRLFGKNLKIHNETTPDVARIKRHEEILNAIDRFVSNKRKKLLLRIEKELSDIKSLNIVKYDSNDNSLFEITKLIAKEIDRLHKKCLNEGNQFLNFERYKEIQSFLDNIKNELYDAKSDLKDFYFDLHRWFNVDEYPEFKNRIVDLQKFAKWQFYEGEFEYSGLDEDQTIGLDGVHMNDGTPFAICGAFDYDDLTLLCILLQKNIGEIKSKNVSIRIYSHVYIDEIQEYSIPELLVMKHTFDETSAVSLAGDLMQNIRVSSKENSWKKIIEILDLKYSHSARLETVYRSTKEIAEFSYKLLGDIADSEMPKTVKHGAPVKIEEFQSEDDLAIELTNALTDLMNREPRATCAVICENPDKARFLFNAIKDKCNSRLVLHGDFKFVAGIDVTTVENVRGLEFDYVVIPDASAKYYQDNSFSRRTLHVAASRAIYQLLVMAAKPISGCIKNKV